jgi:hypothetical protein
LLLTLNQVFIADLDNISVQHGLGAGAKLHEHIVAEDKKVYSSYVSSDVFS